MHAATNSSCISSLLAGLPTCIRLSNFIRVLKMHDGPFLLLKVSVLQPPLKSQTSQLVTLVSNHRSTIETRGVTVSQLVTVVSNHRSAIETRGVTVSESASRLCFLFPNPTRRRARSIYSELQEFLLQVVHVLSLENLQATLVKSLEQVSRPELLTMEALYVFQELNYIHAYPNSFKAALELKIPDILAAAGPGESLTSQQIADRLPRKSHDAAQKLERILRLLAHKGIFSASDSEPTRYGLTEVSKYFVTNSEFDLTPYAMALQRRDMVAPLHHLREAVEEEDANGFVLANGSEVWTYGSLNPDFNEAFNAAMRSRSNLLNSVVARCYEGFKNVHCLVDVGGGVGGALAMIVAEHAHIRGRNFDLPHVIATAPSIPGVEHVPGNFFEFVPSGDATLLQQVLHDWGDEESLQILNNCHKALPQNGKVLVQEHVIEPSRNSAAKTGAALNSDIAMLTLTGKGKERTTTDWKRLLEAAGFSQISFLSLEGLDLIESVKT